MWVLTQQSNLDRAFIETKTYTESKKLQRNPHAQGDKSFKRQSVLAFPKASGQIVQSPTRRYSWTGEMDTTVDRKVLLARRPVCARYKWPAFERVLERPKRTTRSESGDA